MKLQTVLEALADPNRRRILDLLKGGRLNAGDIGARFSITAASLSHHLAKLKAADLVIAEREGQNIYYSIHTTVFEDSAAAVAEFLSLGGRKGDRQKGGRHAKSSQS